MALVTKTTPGILCQAFALSNYEIMACTYVHNCEIMAYLNRSICTVARPVSEKEKDANRLKPLFRLMPASYVAKMTHIVIIR
jgi:hypothetical protein